ncbi:hypothetical protein BCU80_07750 [Vibrio breoganii]|nr:hypothetical protein BCU80_07750 [Vibrio breoganii]
MVEGVSTNSTREISDVDEINKVSRRLGMWAKPERQAQYNSQILNAFIELSNSGFSNITEQDLSKRLGHPDWFSSNFVQMKAKSDRNHGKVFDTSSGYIKIWEPISSAVNEYGRKVLNTCI